MMIQDVLGWKRAKVDLRARPRAQKQAEEDGDEEKTTFPNRKPKAKGKSAADGGKRVSI